MFGQLIQRYSADLDATLRQVVDLIAAPTPEFGLQLRYPMGWIDDQGQPSTEGAGKRIRPLLVLLSTETAGGDWHTALPAAAAVELLHNFSLIHDDIEDDSPTRHGRPTVWKIWGLANAINAGDALFGLAYAALEGLSLAPEVTVKVWRTFNQTVIELTRGQHLDMRFEHQDAVSVQDYLSMIRGKSAALLAACAQMGALIACGDERLAQHYADFGLNLGIAFQIRDDILGIWGDPAVTGKSAATDIISRKKSLPVLYGLAQSEALRHLYERDKFGETDVAEAVRLLDAAGARTYVDTMETDFYSKALAAIDQTTAVGSSDLIRFIETLFRRTY